MYCWAPVLLHLHYANFLRKKPHFLWNGSVEDYKEDYKEHKNSLFADEITAWEHGADSPSKLMKLITSQGNFSG